MNNGHLSDDEIELYCLHRLPEAAAGWVEEHLLLCVSCQLRCEEMQLYVNTLRRALAESAAPSENNHP